MDFELTAEPVKINKSTSFVGIQNWIVCLCQLDAVLNAAKESKLVSRQFKCPPLLPRVKSLPPEMPQ